MYAWARVPLYISGRLMIFGKNLFELPLIEADKALSEEEFFVIGFFSFVAGRRRASGSAFCAPECEACFIA